MQPLSLCQRRAGVGIDLTGCVTAVCVSAAITRRRSVIPPFQIESLIRFEYGGEYPLNQRNTVTEPLYGLGWLRLKKTAAAFLQLLSLCWRRAIFPGRRQPSIVATDELNFRVRNGNGWTLIVIGTNFVVADLTGCASCGCRKGRIKLACVRSLLLFKLKHPLPFECGGRVLCTLKTEQRGDKEGPEPAVLANL